MANRKFYVVWEGRAPGIYDSWEECKAQVEGLPDARFKSFPDQRSATEAFRGNPADHIGLISSIARHQAEAVNYDAFPEIRQNALAVDAACSGNPGPAEYRGVYVATGQEMFRMGPFQGGTNNIAEFIALVHGLAYLEKIGRPDIPVYTDSRTARSWLRTGKAKTTVKRTAANAPIMDLLERALAWARTHVPANEVLVWDTPRWGEIPADFGRK